MRVIYNMPMRNYQYMDGNWVDQRDLKISAYDLSVTRGFGVFDFLRAYNNKPFMLKEHIDRFFNSLKILKLKPVKTRSEIAHIVYEGLKKNNFGNTYIKIIQTGGMSNDGVTPNGRHSFIIMFSPATVYPSSYFEKGIKLITTPMGRIYPSAKSLNYMAGVMAMRRAKKEKAVEALYIDSRYIYECVTTNFFSVMKGALITTRHNILRGITRKATFEIAKKLNIPVLERDLLVKEIPHFEEAFITTSTKEVMPVIKIDKIRIGSGKPGPITQSIMTSFKTYVRSHTQQ